MKYRTIVLCALLFTVPLTGALSQDNGEEHQAGTFESPTEQAILAMGIVDYPVSPGDQYSLTYVDRGSERRAPLFIQSNMNVNLGLFGNISAEGMTFNEFREAVQQIVEDSFPSSYPQVTITRLGRFEVDVRGEVDETGRVRVNGLERLSSIVSDNRTSDGSIRNVRVIDRDGNEQVYDLFRAARDGEDDQDPYIRPGDRIEIDKADRTVSVSGAVRRSGTYQLLEGEDMDTLIEEFAGGLTREADAERVRIVRVPEEPGETSISLLVNLLDDEEPEGAGEAFEQDEEFRFMEVDEAGLEDGDSVTVRVKDEFRPVADLEGAVLRRAPTDDPEDEERLEELRYERFSYRFRRGDMLSDILRSNEDRIHPDADLEELYVSREREDDDGETTAESIPVDARALLRERDADGDIEMEGGDRIVIPFQEQTALVTGEGANAGLVSVDGTTRLSDVVDSRGRSRGSVRRIQVDRRDGGREIYDLFQFQRYGDEDENPYIRPGDRVQIEPAERRISVSGAVERTGTYELLEDEDMDTLIEEFAGGLDEDADRTSIRVRRRPRGGPTELTVSVNDQRSEILTLYVDYDEPARPDLIDRDEITVDTLDRYLPAAFLEGAISEGGGAPSFGTEDIGTSGAASGGRQEIRFNPGVRLRDIIEDEQGQFLPEADLEESYVIRGDTGEHVPVDLYDVLYEGGEEGNLEVLPNDRVVIPFRQRWVMVSGAVNNPGPVRYIPGRTFEYYLTQAGGINPDRRWGRSPSFIENYEGERRDTDEPLEPEDTIHYRTNNPFFYIQPVATAVSTVIGISQIIDLVNDF